MVRVPNIMSVKLLIPTVPSTFYCVGINYREDIIASARRRAVEPVFPQKPDIGYRANNALCAHGDPIVKPRDAGEIFQYEGELVAVIGKGNRGLSPISPDFSISRRHRAPGRNDVPEYNARSWNDEREGPVFPEFRPSCDRR